MCQVPCRPLGDPLRWHKLHRCNIKEKSSLSANLDYRGREVLFSAGRETHADYREVKTVLARELETPGRALCLSHSVLWAEGFTSLILASLAARQ